MPAVRIRSQQLVAADCERKSQRNPVTGGTAALARAAAIA